MRGPAALIGFACLAAIAAGCSRNPYAQWSKLDVVYASQVPIYPGAQVEDAMGGHHFGQDTSGPVSETITYWFKMEPTQYDQILAYYEKELPNARRIPGADGEVRFEITPQGAQSGEKVWVVVGRDLLKIGEETKPGRHRES